MESDSDARILFLFRHGQTDWNHEGRLQGHIDTPLNATGLAQAHALGERLRPHCLDAVLSSDLARARTTAEIVATAIGVPLFIETGLREVDVGAAEGLLWAEAKIRFGEGLTERWYSDGDVAFPGGETGIATRMRGLRALHRFAAAHPYRRIGVSTHGAMVRQLMKHALPSETHAGIRNAALYVLRYEPSDGHLIVVEREGPLPNPPSQAEEGGVGANTAGRP